MGMDVYGIEPKNEEGKYFRANVWSWRPIHALIGMANGMAKSKLVPEETMRDMANNDGAGLRTQRKCDILAKALEKLLADAEALRATGFLVNRDDRDPEEIVISFPLEESCCVKNDGSFIREEEVQKMTAEEKKTLRSPYFTSYSHVREFVKFLRACGGFEVH